MADGLLEYMPVGGRGYVKTTAVFIVGDRAWIQLRIDGRCNHYRTVPTKLLRVLVERAEDGWVVRPDPDDFRRIVDCYPFSPDGRPWPDVVPATLVRTDAESDAPARRRRLPSRSRLGSVLRRLARLRTRAEIGLRIFHQEG